MFSPLRFLTLLLVSLSLGLARPAQASHAQGGSLTYVSLGGNSYRVRVDFFRDCSGILPSPSFTLNCQTACNSMPVTATLTQTGPPFIGTPYSSTIQPLAVCPLSGPAPTTAPANFAAYHYEGTVTLVPNQWTLSVEESARPTTTNLSSGGTLHLEATLDNRTRTNTSATFSNLPVFFVPNGQPNLLHIGAFDADGDSLSYALVRPLNGCGTYETYAPYPPSLCQSVVLSNVPPCFLTCPSGGGRYTARLPIAVKLDTVGTCPSKMMAPRFAFDSLSGAFAFTPNRFLNTTSATGDNKYVVDVQVTEWRRVGSTRVAVGTVRRDMLWIVYDGAAAVAPRLAASVAVQSGSATTTQPLGTPIAVRTGEPIAVTFGATSTLTGTPLTFTLEQNTVPGAVVQNLPTPGTGRLTFTPALTLPDGLYRVSLTVTDDASPLRNLVTVPVAFRVYSTTLAARAGAGAAPIAAYPTPFTDQVEFQLARPGAQALVVCDPLGRVVAHLVSEASGRVRWQPAPGLTPGLYLARTPDGTQTVRLLRASNE